MRPYWGADSYDGPDTWVDDMMLSREQYRKDSEPTVAQRREPTTKTMQLDMDTDELWNGATGGNQQREEWRHINNNVEALCMEMYEQAEWTQDTLMNMRKVIKASCCGEPSKARNHASRIRNDDDHVDCVRAI